MSDLDLGTGQDAAGKATAVRRHSAVGVTQATVSCLQQMIKDGRLKPGDRLPSERDLAQDLSVSRTALREALSILATIGQITAAPGGRGFLIAGATDGTDTASWRFAARYSLAEVYQFRHIAESHAAQLAAIRRTDADLEEMRQSIDLLRNAAHAGELDAYARADFDFHHIILRISGNRLLIDIHRTFAGVVLESQRLPTRRPGPLLHAVNEHERILQAIAMNDPDGAGYYMRTHIGMAGSRAGLPPAELP